MDYTPHTPEDIRQMLDAVNVSGVEDLFEPIPQTVRLGRSMDLPSPLSESEVFDLMQKLAARNTSADDLVCFAGGGAYDHYIPAAVKALAGRSEFMTSYTPYQPELSQGVLGAIFDYQSCICELSGMEVCNAGVYDGASAITEAVAMAIAAAGGQGAGRGKVIVSEAVNPNYLQVLKTMAPGLEAEIVTASCSSGITDMPSAQQLGEAACLVVAQPNFFGCIEDLRAAADAAHRAGALLIVHLDFLSAGVLESPGALGADIVTGEGQSLGSELNFGGPYLGIFAARKEHLRRMPGRICGRTLDSEGRPGYVLTLQTREQHIRRERATSNVCTDQTLMAITAAIYLSWLGPSGLRELGLTCAARAAYAAERLSSVPGCSLRFDAPFFKEFVLRVPKPAEGVLFDLAARGWLAGPSLDIKGAPLPLENCLLIAATERRSNDQIERLAEDLERVLI